MSVTSSSALKCRREGLVGIAPSLLDGMQIPAGSVRVTSLGSANVLEEGTSARDNSYADLKVLPYASLAVLGIFHAASVKARDKDFHQMFLLHSECTHLFLSKSYDSPFP